MRFAAGCFVLSVSLATPLAAQTTLFNTEDFRKDQARWTDPAYYLYNTARQLTDMQVDNRFGQKGSGTDKYQIKTPYAFKTSQEHYDAWLAKANGGTKHTIATLPDWDGVWTVQAGWLASTDIQASTLAAAMTPQYREYYVQMAKAEAEGRHWWASSFCLPEGFARNVSRGPKQVVIRPGQVLMVTDTNVSTDVRWVYMNKGHLPEREQFPHWVGESIGFWDGNALVVHTNQIRQWTASHSLFEWSDQLSAVERYERQGKDIVAEITLYDPVAFLYPLHAKFRLTPDADDRMVFSTCTDTNGTSSNIYAGPDGIVNERVPGDPQYWDPNDPRPWAKHFAIGERRSGK
ncbi:MAG: hypothetical protein HOP16_16490 [Acidobacteria bacterium]|nr:hypothetical protein [Acidobacteriota bacterium]